MTHKIKPMHGRLMRSHNLRRSTHLVFEQDVPRVYPFMLGYGGMGTVDPGEVIDQPVVPLWQTSSSFMTRTAAEQPAAETEQITKLPTSVSAASYTPEVSQTLIQSQTSPPPLLTPTPTSSIEVPLTATTTSTPPTTSASSPISSPMNTAIPTSSLVAAITALATLEASSSSFSSTSSLSIEIITSVSVISSPTTTSTVQAFKQNHPYALYVAFGLMVLILLGVICTSIAWFVRRRRRRREQIENQQWIGSVLNNDPDDKDIRELERGGNPTEPGMAGIGTVQREAAYPPLTPPLLSSWHFRDSPMPNNGSRNCDPHHGFHPVQIRQPWGHSSLLKRGGPTAIDRIHHGLDGGGLTFRQDPNGALTFDQRVIGPSEGASYPNPHGPFTSAAPSHYSYEGAGPFAVTNLMPGDISSRASETSLGRQTSKTNLDRLIPLGSGSKVCSGSARSLGLPTGRRDDPNPWRRYEGVEDWGGAIGAKETGKDWGATIRSGIHSAVGRIVGGDGTGAVGSAKIKPIERGEDRFTELVRQRRPRKEWKADSDAASSECDDIHTAGCDNKPDDDTDGAKATALADSGHSSPEVDKSRDGHPIHRLEREPAQIMIPDSRGWVVEESPDGSRGKIHIVAEGARDLILRRLGSNASVATRTTVYSTDSDPVFSSESATTTRANTIATSRRDTISTRSGCVGMDRSRQPSTTSSDWGTLSMAKALGMSLPGRTRDDRHGH
ncbi:hypothetical protein OPQ81_002275 [Rhizoctonia solani]|nr:hypothetical protein OPQ81_002275 [Rhizoctonia solani]